MAALLALTFLVVLAAPARAADTIAGADPFVLGYQDTVDTTGFGLDPAEPFTATGDGDCGGRLIAATEWYSFTGTGRDVEIGASSTAGVDTVLAVYATSAVAANEVECNDDASSSTRNSAVTVDSARGVHYLVQVGGCEDCYANDAHEEGSIVLSMASFPANDERADATALPLGDPTDADNLGAFEGENGEDLFCDTDTTNNSGHFGKSVWFKFTLPSDGKVVITASGIDTVSQLYRGSETSPIACNDQGGTGTAGPSRITVANLAAGDYLLQVGGWVFPGTDPFFAADGFMTLNVDFTANLDHDGDGINDKDDCAPNNPAIHPGAVDVPGNTVDENCDGHAADMDNDGVDVPADCNDTNPAIRPGVADTGGNTVDENCDRRPADVDGDGIDTPADCNDRNPAIKPGAVDIPENGVDEDCDKRDAVAQLTRSGLAWVVAPDGLTIKKLVVTAVKGMTIRVKCSGKKCFKAYTVKPKKAGKIDVATKLKKSKRKRASGSKVTVDLIEKMTVGKRRVFLFVKGKPTVVKNQCLAVRTSKLVKCP